MKKLYLHFTALIISTVAISASAQPQFNKDALQRFEKTNKCSGCDLSGAIIKSNHSQAILDNANLSNIHAGLGEPLNFSLANLQNANLSGAWLVQANFSQADLTGAHFDGANLNSANFYGAKGANLKNAATLCGTTLPDGTQGSCTASKS